ncbi:MAG: tRNA (adenine(22)-N(1))-methyltransferase TrmK [Bacteriovoracaceae bacterium]
MVKTTIIFSSGGSVALSFRLAELASFYQSEESIYDIGCDHGLLGLSFKTNPYSVDIISKTIDADITEPPYIFTLKINGQKAKIKKTNSLIFIAGMGGKTIIDILKNWSEENLLNCSQIVLSPHRNLLELRAYLHHENFILVGERVLSENNQFYEVFSVTKSKNIGPRVSLYGEELWERPESANYLKHQLGYLEYHRDCQSLAYLNYLKRLAK